MSSKTWLAVIAASAMALGLLLLLLFKHFYYDAAIVVGWFCVFVWIW